MADLALIRTAIKSKLEAIPSIGVVHEYERYAKRESDLKGFYETDINGQKQIRGWFVRRVSTTEKGNHEGRFTDLVGWQIRGYMSLVDADASELVFDDLIESIRVAFRSDETLGGLVDTSILDNQAGVQLDDSGPVLFAGVLCHGCRLSFVTQHFI